MRTVTTLIATHAGAEMFLFVRNVLLARLLGPSEMGVATLFAMSLRLLEMGTDLAVDRFMIQSRQGDSPHLQHTAQGILCLRGVVTGILFALVAAPLAQWIGKADSSYILVFMAILPIVKGFVHLDHKRSQRSLSFRSAATVEIAASGVAVLSCLPAFLVFPDYRAALIALLVQGLTWTLVSHWMSERRYGLRLNRVLARRMIAFGLPVAANGLLMFAILQGDRLIVARSCSAEELGLYCVIGQFFLVPVLIVSRVFNAYFLPRLSGLRTEFERFLHHLSVGATIVSVVSVLFFVAIAMFGNAALETLYGSAYAVPTSLLLWLGLMQVLRLLRAMPSIAAVSLGNSRQPLMANGFRLLGLVAATIAGLSGFGLTSIAAAGCFGEFLALCVAIKLLDAQFHVPARQWIAPGVIAVGGALAGWSLCCGEDTTGGSQMSLMIASVFLLCSQWKSYSTAFRMLILPSRGLRQSLQV